MQQITLLSAATTILLPDTFPFHCTSLVSTSHPSPSFQILGSDMLQWPWFKDLQVQREVQGKAWHRGAPGGCAIAHLGLCSWGAWVATQSTRTFGSAPPTTPAEGRWTLPCGTASPASPPPTSPSGQPEKVSASTPPLPPEHHRAQLQQRAPPRRVRLQGTTCRPSAAHRDGAQTGTTLCYPASLLPLLRHLRLIWSPVPPSSPTSARRAVVRCDALRCGDG
jgi:hypothetical protein